MLTIVLLLAVLVCFWLLLKRPELQRRKPREALHVSNRAKEKHYTDIFWVVLAWLMALAMLYIVILKAKFFIR